jgi:5'-methylthioadenosine phosphorylase
MLTIGVIGGSGLEDPTLSLPGVTVAQDGPDLTLDTPYGPPSAPIRQLDIAGRKVKLLPRHGSTHTVPPSQINYRANIMALKQAGCQLILATTAVGSLRAEIGRGDLVIVDQFIDFTRHRPVTFHESFDPHSPVHTGMADPFHERLRQGLIASCRALEIPHHGKGTVVTIEGPRFSTRAESNMFRIWGADIINMTTAPEAILAMEAAVPYAAVAMSTDYDCWKTDEPPVTWEDILEIFTSNAQKVVNVLLKTIVSLEA